MRAFSKFGDWIKGKKEITVVLVGLSGAGKTTLLYESCYVEDVNTIPTVAFNVEKIDHNGHRFIVWDMGGEGSCTVMSYDSTDSNAGAVRICDFSSYNIISDSVVLFVHDCGLDEQQTEASIKLLREHLDHLWVLLNKQDLLPTENPSTVALHIRSRFHDELSKCTGANLHWEILDLPRINLQRGGKLLPVLDNVTAALDSITGRLLPSPKTDDDQTYNSTSFEILAQSTEVATRSEQSTSIGDTAQGKYLTIDDDTFWSLFLKADIKHWDHHSYLRAAYKVLMDVSDQKRGIWEASEVFSHHLQRLRHSNNHTFLATDNR